VLAKTSAAIGVTLETLANTVEGYIAGFGGTGKMRVAKLRVGIWRVEVRAKRASI